jgi:hypothetical protein
MSLSCGLAARRGFGADKLENNKQRQKTNAGVLRCAQNDKQKAKAKAKAKAQKQKQKQKQKQILRLWRRITK